jgi:hypothetical protein
MSSQTLCSALSSSVSGIAAPTAKPLAVLSDAASSTSTLSSGATAGIVIAILIIVGGGAWVIVSVRRRAAQKRLAHDKLWQSRLASRASAAGTPFSSTAFRSAQGGNLGSSVRGASEIASPFNSTARTERGKEFYLTNPLRAEAGAVNAAMSPLNAPAENDAFAELAKRPHSNMSELAFANPLRGGGTARFGGAAGSVSEPSSVSSSAVRGGFNAWSPATLPAEGGLNLAISAVAPEQARYVVNPLAPRGRLTGVALERRAGSDQLGVPGLSRATPGPLPGAAKAMPRPTLTPTMGGV